MRRERVRDTITHGAHPAKTQQHKKVRNYY